ncbi:MAG: sugar ABC transporter permease [Firmicutes bacterium]|nr:sugar ABC transporter permease [Candidatus Colivicinus equi]
MRKRKSKLNSDRAIAGVFFSLPQAISLFFLGILPICTAFILSMFDWNGFRAPIFVGLDNFKYIFGHDDLGIAFKNTVYYTLIYVPFNIVLSLLLAILLNKAKGKLFYRAVFFLPQVVTSVAIAVIWCWIFQPQYGILNVICQFLGLTTHEWLRDPNTVMPAIIAMSVWWGLGYNTVLFLASLQNVPKTYLEAAEIDGCNKWQQFFHITLPMISPTTLLVTITSLINSFQVFDQCYLLTNGGPAKRTYTMAIYIYDTAFKQFKLGRASAISLIMFVVIVVISVIQFIVSEKWVNYDA